MSVAAQPIELIQHLREVSESRDVPYDLLCGAIEESLTIAYHEHTGSSSAVARLDQATGGIELFERRKVVDVVEDPLVEVAANDARGFEIGDFVDRPLDPGSFARVAALTAKRVILKRVLEFERERVYRSYRDLEGSLVTGLVQRDVHGALYVLLDDRNEAAMPPWERSPRERHQINEKIVCELQAVRKTPRGPALILSRASERFVRLLVNDRAVVAAARAPGRLTLLMVTRPVEVAAARLQIGNERIEQIPHFEDPLDVMRAAFPRTVRFVQSPHYEGVIIVTEDLRVFERAELVGLLVRKRVIVTKPEDLDELLADLEAETAVGIVPDLSDAGEIDPELIAKLEQFARERSSNPIK